MLLWVPVLTVAVTIVLLAPGGGPADTASRSTRIGPDIDPSDWVLVFDEPFDDLSASAWRRGPGETSTRWIAHTPWYGDFGDAAFRDPGEGFPFTVAGGILTIEARRGADGAWESGLLSTRDPLGGGFHASHGYFEARMRLPPGEGVWPAFWLGSDTLPDGVSGEIDVVEFYGHAPDRYQSAWHVWHRDAEDRVSQRATALTPVVPPAPSLTERFHRYGVEITDAELIYYLDRRIVWRQGKPAPFTELRFFPLVNLALGSGYPTDATPDPSWLLVDHVRVWQRPRVEDRPTR